MDRSVTTHVAREQSAELAYFQANDQGGLALNGAEPREFGAVFCTIQDDQESQEFDGKSRPEAAVQAAGFLVRTLGLPAILGPAASSDTKAVFEDLADTGALVISPSATSPELTGLDPETVSDDAPGLLWRTAPSDALQGAVIAADMRGPGMGRVDPDPVSEVVVIHETGAYGEGLFDVFAGEFVARGGSPPQELVYAGTSQTELTDAISDAGLTSAQEVLFISSQAPQIVTFLETADQLAGYAEKNIFLTDAAANPDVLAADTSLFARVRATRLAPLDADNPVYSSFIVAYDARYRANVQDFSYAANAYDAAWLLVYGAAWAQFQAQGGISGQHIARGLRHVSVGEKVELRASTWTSVQQAFKAGDSIDVAGASGELDYDPATEETSADVEVWKPANGTIEGIYKVSP